MSSEALVQPRPRRPKPIRVLLADPDESLQPAYRESLFQEGFELAAAISGLECLAQMRQCAPDVLVLEPQLPWGDGEDLLAVLGGVPALAIVPVMVLTSCRDARLLKALSRFPVCDYQLKPLAVGRLAARLRAILAHPKLTFSLAEQNGRLECLIAQRTDGRIRNLRVETIDGRVIVRGRAASHHVKRVALAVVREAFEASMSQAERIDVDIEVVPSDGWHARRCVLSEPGDESSNEFALTKELALTKEN